MNHPKRPRDPNQLAKSIIDTATGLLAKRTEADFREWRDHRDWTARKYAMWQAGEKLPSQKPSTLMKCVCGQQFDSHRIEDTIIHVPHITARGGYEIRH